jgi:uncharacterized protein with NAD-binding domain and iron-sulfur cluster
MGHRLGGKGATGRDTNTSYRILEHGTRSLATCSSSFELFMYWWVT